MKIVGGQVGMMSSHTYSEQSSKTESLRIFGGRSVSPGSSGIGVVKSGLNTDQVQISDQARKLLRDLRSSVPKAESVPETENLLSAEDEQKIVMIEDMLEMLTGKKIKIIVPELKRAVAKAEQASVSASAVSMPANQGNGFVFEAHSSYSEQESVAFKAEGVIKTADGREISFMTQMAMSRSFSTESNLVIRGGQQAIDPLVVNFGGSAATLTGEKYSFDLDSDGTTEQISFVGSGSGFLARDINNDGEITSGKELFGPQAGNGFIELAGFDEDNNGWIDENDSVFAQLRLWIKDEAGNDQLLRLADKDIGAICLQFADTQFAVKDGANQAQGQLQSTGIYLTEKGNVGTVQQLDLVV